MNIKKMLPYLQKEDLDSLLEACVKGEIAEDDFKIQSLYPFLDEDQLMKILRSAMDGNFQVSPKGILPFLSEEQIGNLLLELEQNESELLSIDDLLPFLEEGQIKKLFADLMDKAKNKTE